MLISMIKRGWPFLLVFVLLCVGFALYGAKLKKLAYLSGIFDDQSVENNSMDIKSISEIGEIISSKYYGEVLETSKTVLAKEDSAFIKRHFDQLWSTYQALRPRSHSKFRKLLKRMNMSDQYDLLSEYFDNKKELFRFLENSGDESWKSFYSRKRMVDEGRRANESRKNLIAYIGRGTVTAGIDLRLLDVDEVMIKDNVVSIYGLEPSILDADINPWYVPPTEKHKGVLGYQLVVGGNLNFPRYESEVMAVKHLCKVELVREAMERNILDMAWLNGSEVIRDFIAAFDEMDGQSFDQINVVLNPYYEIAETVIEDNFIDRNEIEILLTLADSSDQLMESYFPNLVSQRKHLSKLFYLLKTLQSQLIISFVTISPDDPFFIKMKIFENTLDTQKHHFQDLLESRRLALFD